MADFEEPSQPQAPNQEEPAPKRLNLANLPPPPKQPEKPVVIYQAPSPGSPGESPSPPPSNSTQDEKGQGITKTVFNFPKFPLKRTRSAAPGDKQNFSKLVPALKKITKKDGDAIAEKDENSGSETEDEEEQGGAASSAPALIFLTVHAAFLRRSESIRISPFATVAEAIKMMMSGFDLSPEKFQPSDFKICRTGKAGFGPGDTRIWLDHSLSLHSYSLKTGDELKLKNSKDRYVVQINKPPQTTIYSFAYDLNTTVRVALMSLLKDSPNTQVEKYGLYYPMKGLWLEETKTLEFYEIDPTHTIDLRQLSQEIFLKVVIADSTNKVGLTLKVIKSQTVAEVIAMINRKIAIENSHQCSLFFVAKNQWLEPNKTIEEYGIEANSILEFKGKFRSITLSVGSDSDGDRTVTILVDPAATVEDVVNVVAMNNPSLEEESHSLVYQYGLALKAGTTVKEISSKEVLEFRVTPYPIKVSPAYDPSSIQTFEVNFTTPLKFCIPMICRRFGIILTDFAVLQKKDGVVMNLEKSLYQQKINPDTLFVIKTTSPGWVQKPLGEASSEDLDFWSEPADNEKNIQFEAGPNGKPSEKILCGTLNKLVERLTDDKTHDLAYVKTFLLTYRSFTTPEILLKKMIERYHVPRPVNAAFEDFERNIKRPIQLRVCNVLKQWIEKHSSDFLEGNNLSPLAHQVLKFVKEILAVDDWKLAKQLLNTMDKLRDGTLSKAMKEFNQDIDPPQIKYPSKENPKLFDHHPEEIARQLTFIEFELFQEIKPSEFLNQNWNRKNSDKISPNILRTSERFNRTVVWVVSSILIKTQIRARVKRMEKLIDIAAYLQSLNNFSTLMAFVAGFNNAAIQRLKFTRAELSSRALKRLESLESLMSAEGSYKHYRSVIHSANPPLVPYIGVYLADLTFIDDGNPNFIEGLINFSKRRLDYGVISEIQLYQNKPFNLIEFPELKALLLDFPEASEAIEKALYENSLRIEPRGAERSQIE